MNKNKIKVWLRDVLKPWIKTPRGAFVAGVCLGTILGKAVLGLIF